MLEEIYYWIKGIICSFCSPNSNSNDYSKDTRYNYSNEYNHLNSNNDSNNYYNRYCNRDCNSNYYSNNEVYQIDNDLHQEMNSYYEALDIIKYSTIISNTKSSSVYLHNNYIYKLVDFPSCYDLYKYCNTIDQLEDNSNILYPLEMTYRKTSLIEKYNYIPDCDLFELITNYTTTQNEKYKIILSVMEAISQLHNAGFAHRDIKPENLFYLPNNKILLIDLIMCSRYDDPLHFKGGTVYYASPQIFQENYIENDWRQTDIWSLGIVIYVIQQQFFPWKNSKECDIYLSYKNYDNKQEYWDSIDNKVISKLLFNSLVINPNERKDINQLIEIFKNEIDISNL